MSYEGGNYTPSNHVVASTPVMSGNGMNFPSQNVNSTAPTRVVLQTQTPAQAYSGGSTTVPIDTHQNAPGLTIINTQTGQVVSKGQSGTPTSLYGDSTIPYSQRVAMALQQQADNPIPLETPKIVTPIGVTESQFLNGVQTTRNATPIEVYNQAGVLGAGADAARAAALREGSIYYSNIGNLNTPQLPSFVYANEYNSKISQQDFTNFDIKQPKPQTLDLITPFQGIPSALYGAFIEQPLEVRNNIFPESANFSLFSKNQSNPNHLLVFGESLVAGGVYIGSGVVFPFLKPSEFFSGIANKPVESLATMGAFAIVGGAFDILPKTSVPTFEPVKGIVTETDSGLNLLTSMRARTGGILGKVYDVTSNLSLKEVDIPELFKGKDYLKIKSPVQRIQLPEQAGVNYLRLDVGEQTLLLPEDIATNVIQPQGTDLVLSNADLIKLNKNTGGGSTGNIFKIPESPGTPFIIASEGITRIRQVGLLEDLFYKPSDFTSEIETAQFKGIKFGKTSEFEGLSFGIVNQRNILYPNEFEGFDFETGGFKQPTIDITRLGETKLKLLSDNFDFQEPTKYEVGEYFGKIGIEKDFAKQANNSFSLSGTKGKITMVDILKNDSRVSSGQRNFMTQDLTVKFGEKQLRASRIKVEGYPMEIKLLYKESIGENLKSDLTQGKQFRMPQKGNLFGSKKGLTMLGENKQLLLPGDEFTLPPVPDNVLDNIFKNLPSNKTKPFTATELKDLGTIGSNEAIQRGTATLLKTIEKTQTKTSFGSLAETTNKGLAGTATATLTKPETKTTTQTKSILKQKQGNTLTSQFVKLNSAQFESFATTGTMQSQKIGSQVSQAQSQIQLQKQLQRQLQGQSQAQGQTQSQAQTQAQTQGQTQAHAQTQAQTQTQTQSRTQTQTGQGFNMYVPNIKLPNNYFQNRKQDDENKKNLKKMIQGFIPQIRKKGKFVNVGNEVLPENMALSKAANVARRSLTRSITLKPAGVIEVDEDYANVNLSDFRQRKPSSKIMGFPVFVQKNALSSRSETQEIQQAKANKHLNKMMGRY